MRKKDREIKEFDQIIEVMQKCDVCRLAFHDGDYPYILPMNFGMHRDVESVTLYFHGALEGKKQDLIRRNPKVGFEMDCGHRLITGSTASSYTMEYESVVGYGTITEVPEEEKYEALCILMEHYKADEKVAINRAVLPITSLWKLEAATVTGKRNKKSGQDQNK